VCNQGIIYLPNRGGGRVDPPNFLGHPLMIRPPLGVSKHVHPLEGYIMVACKVACATMCPYLHSSVTEWETLRRIEGDLSAQDTLITLVNAPEKCAMFPAFASAIYKPLPLPIGTATVDWSFSTMNRILNSERCCLLPGHTCQLMQLAVEGPCVPDVREAKEEELA